MLSDPLRLHFRLLQHVSSPPVQCNFLLEALIYISGCVCCLATASASETRAFPAEKRKRKVPEWTMRWSLYYLLYTPVDGFQSRTTNLSTPPVCHHNSLVLSF